MQGSTIQYQQYNGTMHYNIALQLPAALRIVCWYFGSYLQRCTQYIRYVGQWHSCLQQCTIIIHMPTPSLSMVLLKSLHSTTFCGFSAVQFICMQATIGVRIFSKPSIRSDYNQFNVFNNSTTISNSYTLSVQPNLLYMQC